MINCKFFVPLDQMKLPSSPSCIAFKRSIVSSCNFLTRLHLSTDLLQNRLLEYYESLSFFQCQSKSHREARASTRKMIRCFTDLYSVKFRRCIKYDICLSLWFGNDKRPTCRPRCNPDCIGHSHELMITKENFQWFSEYYQVIGIQCRPGC